MKRTRDLITNIKLIAIHNVMDTGYERFIEESYRHYSKTYNTPLHWAKENMTAEEVMLIKMEDTMDELQIEDLIKMQEDMTRPYETRPMIVPINKVETLDTETDDDAWLAEQVRLADMQDKKKAEEQKKGEDLSLASSMNNLADSIAEIQKALGRTINDDELEKPIKFTE